jgi:hypothetical protein
MCKTVNELDGSISRKERERGTEDTRDTSTFPSKKVWFIRCLMVEMPVRYREKELIKR